MNQETERESVALNVRLPEELHSQVKELAARDTRSLNSEIIVLLREAIRTRGKS